MGRTNDRSQSAAPVRPRLGIPRHVPPPPDRRVALQMARGGFTRGCRSVRTAAVWGIELCERGGELSEVRGVVRGLGCDTGEFAVHAVDEEESFGDGVGGRDEGAVEVR
mmetsp:Transcript_44642/g.52302  ORF Transcript_44642/g.52302 Transcript_44642/m.52302 type:complete len:109 (+) Transcript_44642:596-922(+)